MYLKALKLHGFKSFADPTTLRFEPGVTAIVGPNGCGKSNVADAIRWVLGEQSAKALRGGRMQDVIFEGADTRKTAQMCEVSLLLTDCEKQLGSEFHEIEIMRRVHRDGAGEYFFNGQACRLKDIQKLFMDTGIGRTSYSIMAQGQIDQILSSKPEERRAVFEEAAGITRYKAQRKEALQKLALTDQNLVRIADVVNEVGRQIGSLRRQASKALRHKKLSWKLRHLALAQSGFQYADIRGHLAHLEESAVKLRAAAEERRAYLQEQQTALEERKAARSRLTQRVQEAQQAVFDLRSEKEQADNAANLAQIKRSGLADRLESSRQSLDELEMQLHELNSQVDTGAQDKQLQLTLLGSSDDIFQQRNRDLAIVEGELSKEEQALAQIKFQILQSESQLARLRTECSGFEVDQKTSAHRHAALAETIETARQEQSAAGQRASELVARVEEASVGKARLHQESQDIQRSISELTADFREAQRKLQEIDRGLAQRSARLKLLQQLAEKWEGFGEGAKAILQGRLSDTVGASQAISVAKGIEVNPAHAKAFEALLGSAVEAISVADLATARRILERLEMEQIGAAVLQVSVASGTSAPHALPAGLHPATDALSGADPKHPVVALLAACFIADDLGAFLEFWQANPEFPFLVVATNKGELVDRRGLVSGGHAKKPGNSIVQREIDLRDTARLLAEDQKKHDEQKALIDGIGARLNAAEASLEAKRAEVLQATQEQAAIQAEERSAQQNLESIAQKITRMAHELEGLEAARNESLARYERAKASLDEAEARAEQGRVRVGELETRLTALRTDRDVKRESLSQARLELAEHRQRVEVLDRGIADMERRRNQLSETFSQRQQEVEVWTEQIEQLLQENAGQRARAQQIEETLLVARDQVEQLRKELSEVEQGIASVENAQNDIRNNAEGAIGELNRCEIALAQHQSRAQFIEEDVQREFQIRVGSYDWRGLLYRADEDPPDLNALDLDDEDEDNSDGEPAAATLDASPSPEVSDGENGTDGATTAADGGAGGEGASAAAQTAPKRRRKPKSPKPDPTAEDLEKLEAGADWPAIKNEIEALRKRLGGMGAVNSGAIEEYAELKQRYDFLTGQCDDLKKAKAELIRTIDEINETSLKQFQITFDQIRKNFIHTFQTLFGGGVANLELVEAEDILESGIEITAQPPGTKLKSITLLSGGQKTLTAVGLLFALYMVKPSPFCLLDELDAPLDESNIGRFTDLLKQFVNESQFIIITHNKRTVAAAQTIYGVTMEERGVSKTVSMRFNQARNEIDTDERTLAEAVRGTTAKTG